MGWNPRRGSRVISRMNNDFSDRSPRRYTPEERQARDAARRVEAEKAMRDHDAAQQAFHRNRERLKAERLAREAERTATGSEQA
jgi:hypothetical protein